MASLVKSAVPKDSQEEAVTLLIETFLADLATTMSPRRETEVSVEEVERRIKGLASFLSILSQRWSLVIISLLYMRSLNFNEFRDLLPGISSRTLTDKLRMLERSGMLTRTVVSSAPVRVKYSLTQRGREIALSCIPLLYQLRKRHRR